MKDQYDVLNPWAEVDPAPLKSISAPVSDLAGKRIGLFCNSKRSTPFIMTVVERRMKERFPTAEFSRFHFPWYQDITGTPDEAKLAEWVKGVDVVISAVGD
jgi:hypothetical protein